MARRRPEFETGLPQKIVSVFGGKPMPKQSQLNKLGDAGSFKGGG